jgi:4-methyl-5(b-hydroxyethyl)-thiazole monophosphate biosynthesis
MATAIVLLAPGFEEIEAVAAIDVLRRAGLEVTAASLAAGEVRASRRTLVVPDIALEDVPARDWDAVVLPGGMPGAENLAADERVLELVRRQLDAGRVVAAICAAPAVVLGEHGLLGDRRATCHPALADRLGKEPADERVVVDVPLITSRGPGTAIEWALAIVTAIAGPAAAGRVEGPMLVARPT